MLRTAFFSSVVLCVGCGGKAVDDPEFFETMGSSSSSSGSTASAADENQELCDTVCQEWAECGVGVTADDCLPGCLDGYASAAEISCGDEYNALLECNFQEGVCGLEGVCEAEGERYTSCIQENF